MYTRVLGLAAAAFVSLALTGCGQGAQSGSTTRRPGAAGVSYLVTASRPERGTITSGDGRIACGTAPGATSCGPVSYAWNEAVTLTATADAGAMFGTWAGDCSGRTKDASGKYTCTLDTTQYGADKFVVAVFGDPGRTQHPNFSDHQLHGPEFLAWAAKKTDSFDCYYCHGATLNGVGIALSCNECHARAGYPDWRNACTFCHEAPPASPPLGIHPGVSSDLTGCSGCHAETVDPRGVLVAGGKHMDGTVQATGGHPDWTSPALHGPQFFDFVARAPSAIACTSCHGANYESVVTATRDSCNSCHATAGWTAWRSNCSFCHGEKNPVSQLGNYDLARNPMWSAPASGAHAAHLVAGATLGGRFAAPFACETCHAVPTDLSHLGGAGARAAVALTAAGRASLPPALGTYDLASGTCTTYCHGSSASPPWTTTGLQCGTCHALPPPPASGHPSVPSALTGCAVCHTQTMKADGSLDLAGGAHLDGKVQASGSHGDYTSPTVHGPKFFGFLAGAGGDCRLCHGASDGGGVGPSCNACHESAGWMSWQTNCSFCHGEKNAESQRGGYDLAVHPMWTAPATGAHAAHLAGSALAGAFRCATCHAVPTDLSHVSGADARAAVALAGAGQASLPAALGTYDPASRTCTTYCHGASASPAWTAGGIACGACHALPPTTPNHPSVSGSLAGCSTCHYETVSASGTILVAGGKHLDGVVQASGHPNYASPALHGPKFFELLAGTASENCRSCHGATFDGGSAPSCNACHASNGWADWQTSCSFCHGARTSAAKAGYVLSAHPEWAAPPDAVQQRLGAGPQPSRTGAHQAHLTGVSQSGERYAGAFSCATCHTVPGDLAHAARAAQGLRAPVALSGANQALLPQNLGSYDPATGTCTTYCHGTTLTGAVPQNAKPAWGSAAIQCTNCHGYPPATGTGTSLAGCNTTGCHATNPLTNLHEMHAVTLGALCSDCHAATWQAAPPYSLTGVHVNGSKDVQFGGGALGSWDAAVGACNVSCHGATIQWR